jgi:hypothetical protein
MATPPVLPLSAQLCEKWKTCPELSCSPAGFLLRMSGEGGAEKTGAEGAFGRSLALSRGRLSRHLRYTGRSVDGSGVADWQSRVSVSVNRELMIVELLNR